MCISMLDTYGREASSLRIAVTQRCNQNCIYCHNEGQVRTSKEMTIEQIQRILKASAAIGAKKVKITGGEPLVRKDIVDVVASCSENFREVSLTTNGIGLDKLAGPLRDAGLARLNISMDTLDGLTYQQITCTDNLPKLLRGIDAASEAGFRSIKLNTVVLNGLNHTELEDLIAFSAEKNAMLQLIELTPKKEYIDSPFYQAFHYDLAAFEKTLGDWTSEIRANEIHDRKRYVLRVNGWNAVVEIVRPMSNRNFCENCTRIRVTSDGRIKPCLLTNTGEIETLDLLEAGEDEETLQALFAKAILSRKPYWD
jgi:cyclic pyranopterin phosphate synthase